MYGRLFYSSILFALSTSHIFPQAVKPANAKPVPRNRVNDSYAIYSQILPVDEFRTQASERPQLFLLEKVTAKPNTAVLSCVKPPDSEAKAW